jgi:pimeloyl-ACP methyl ester carboxylesterase
MLLSRFDFPSTLGYARLAEACGIGRQPANPMDFSAISAALKGTQLRDSNRLFARSTILWFLLALILLIGIGIYSLRFELRSYVFLIQFLDPRATGLVVRLESHAVETQEITLLTPDGPVRSRLYFPRGVARPEGMLLLHGIHHLGIDEPRLMNFAHAAAGNGFAVLTPELVALADYHVDGASIGTIGQSAAWLQQRLGTGPVTVVAVSFAGGLSLLAACDPQYAPHIRSLVLMGAYDSLERVLTFLATSEAVFPDGRKVPYRAHDYGAAVFVYSDLGDFFPPSDLAVAHEALRDWLWERPGDAQALLPRLSPESRATMEILIARQIERLRPELLKAIRAHEPQLSAISPEGKLRALHTPVFILHGSTDDIIPSTESLWLEREIPKPYLREALITPVFSHVDADKHAVWTDQLHLMEFLANVLRVADQ